MPIAFNKNIGSDTHFALWKIEESKEELFSGLQLKRHELNLTSSFNNGKRLLHWLSTRLLLRTMLNTTEYIDCRFDQYGKPFLANLDYKISLSHSYEYAAVIISKHYNVGIDVELMKNKIDVIKHKFLSDLELAENITANHIDGLYVCWCAKEAIYKWQGKAGLSFRDHIRIHPFDVKSEGSIIATVILPEGNAEVVAEYLQTPDGYMVGYIAQN